MRNEERRELRQNWVSQAKPLSEIPSPVSDAPARSPQEIHAVDSSCEPDLPWMTIVWDDPVNLMRYVTYVFQTLFGFSEEKATSLMLQVHHDGKAVVTSGAREKVEIDVVKLQQAGLWATMQQST